MNGLATKDGKSRSNAWFIYAIIAIALIYLLPASFNPFGLFFEIPASNYRTLSETIELPDLLPCRIMVREVMNRDGKLTQENSVSIWQAWEKSVPVGTEIGRRSDVLDRAAERQRLINLVGAVPTHTVWTPLSK